MEQNLQFELQHLRDFEEEMTELLIEDGYLEDGEEAKIEFNEDELVVNGEEVKEKDLNKYLDLRKKYFPRDEGRFRYRIH